MPRLLTRDDLSRSKGASSRIPSQPKVTLGASIARLGNVISDEGQRNFDADIQRRNADDAIDMTRARSTFNSAMMRERAKYSYDQDQDYGTWTKRFDDEAPKIQEKSGNLIRNPKARERFFAETGDELTRHSLGVDGAAREVDQTRKKQEIDLSQDNALESSIDPKTDEATKERMIRDTTKSIDDLVKAGVLTPEEGAARRIKFTREYAKRRAEADAGDDPEKAAGWLRGDTAGAAALIKKKEGYRETPYWDVNHQRVGYGSDTITTADGQVVKVTKGMRVNRADAERDLERRIKETQSGIAGKIGTDAWSKLSPGATAALTSLAYNYGELPASVAAAAKSGDPGAIAQAVRGLAPHNGGVNAKRRFEEAAIIDGSKGNEYAALERPGYYDFLSSSDRQAYLSKSEGEIARRDTERTKRDEIDVYNTRQSIEDDVAQITETGKASDIDPNAVNATLGPAATAKWLENRDTAVKTYKAVSALEGLDDAGIEEHLGSIEPKSGDPNFANQQKIYDKAEARATKLRDLRLKDPAQAVDDSPIVKEVKNNEAYDPKEAGSIQDLVKARLMAQQAVGIHPSMQQPITRKEAYRIIAPVQKTLDMWDAALVAAAVESKGSPSARRVASKAAQAEAEQQIRAVFKDIEDAYGPYAQDVLAFAIAESVRDKEIGSLAARAMKKISNREAPSRAELQALDATTETSTAAKAVRGELPEPKASAPPAAGQPRSDRSGAQPGPAFGVYPNMGIRKGQTQDNGQPWPDPTDPAVQDLIANPHKAKKFDEIYGAGAAERWLPKTR